jgi:RNA polymerase sigma factor (TIGR02999 family)
MKPKAGASVSEERSSEGDLTALLRQWSGGDAVAGERLVGEVYQQLKQIARRQLERERDGHTLQPTALVHEAYLKLSGGRAIDWHDRAHFFAVSARVIRQILVDSGRALRAQRRGGAARALTLDTGLVADDVGGERSVDILALDQALDALARLQPKQAQIVELRYFGGLTIEEAAVAIGVSVPTVDRLWRAARAWLHVELEDPS